MATNIKPIPIPPPSQGSNSAALKQAFLDRSTELGASEAKAGLSRYEWLMHLGECAYRKEIDKADIGDGYDAYHLGRKNAKVRGKQNTGKDRPNRISEATHVWFVAQLPTLNGLKALANIDKVVEDNPELPGEIAVHLINACKMQEKFPSALLSPDAILNAMQKPPKKDKTYADELYAMAQKLEKLGETNEWTPHTRGAHSSLMAAVADEGGTSRQREAAIKAADKAAKLAAARAKRKK